MKGARTVWSGGKGGDNIKSLPITTTLQIKNIRLIHQGKYLCYYELDYINLDGNIKTYEMVTKNRKLTAENIGTSKTAVTMLVLNEAHDKILILKEFRMGVNDYVYSSSAGLIDAGEDEFKAAKRELREETGLTLTRVIQKLSPTYTCAPVTDDITVMLICEATGEIQASDSPDEEIEARWYTKEEVRELLSDDSYHFAGRMQAYCYCWAYGL